MNQHNTPPPPYGHPAPPAEQMGYYPPPPPQPPKKSKKWWWIGGGALGFLFLVGAASGGGESSTPETAVTEAQEPATTIAVEEETTTTEAPEETSESDCSWYTSSWLGHWQDMTTAYSAEDVSGAEDAIGMLVAVEEFQAEDGCQNGTEWLMDQNSCDLLLELDPEVMKSLHVGNARVLAFYDRMATKASDARVDKGC